MPNPKTVSHTVTRGATPEKMALLYKEAEAKRRLIAAAPALLEALKGCQVAIFMLNGSENDAYRAASTAIRQATGGENNV